MKKCLLKFCISVKYYPWDRKNIVNCFFSWWNVEVLISKIFRVSEEFFESYNNKKVNVVLGVGWDYFSWNILYKGIGYLIQLIILRECVVGEQFPRAIFFKWAKSLAWGVVSSSNRTLIATLAFSFSLCLLSYTWFPRRDDKISTIQPPLLYIFNMIFFIHRKFHLNF